jgi:hypothetical protein
VLKATDPRFVALDARLGAVQKGGAPKDNPERLALAQRAYDLNRFATATKLLSEALDTDPKLGIDRQFQHRYNAACAAALALAGQGEEPTLDATAKARLRRQAYDWLSAELVVWSGLIRSGPAKALPVIAQTLKHWLEDTDLAAVRDPNALSQLSDSDREAWQALWRRVEDLIRQAENSGLPTTARPPGELPVDPFAR